MKKIVAILILFCWSRYACAQQNASLNISFGLCTPFTKPSYFTNYPGKEFLLEQKKALGLYTAIQYQYKLSNHYFINTALRFLWLRKSEKLLIEESGFNSINSIKLGLFNAGKPKQHGKV